MKKILFFICMLIFSINICFAAEYEEIEVEEVEIIKEEDNNGFLKSLRISNGSLEPKFQKDILEYEMTVSNEITSVDISLETESEKANVISIEGFNNFEVGKNDISILIEAENNEITEYIVHVTREGNEENVTNDNVEEAEKEPTQDVEIDSFGDLKITYKDETYLVKMNYDDIAIPAFMEAGTTIYKGVELKSLNYEKYDFSIVYLRKSVNEIYEMYSIKNQNINKIMLVENDGNYICLLPIPTGTFNDTYKQSSVTINEKEINAYQKIDGKENLYYLYGVNTNGVYEKFVYDEDTSTFTHELPLETTTSTQDEEIENKNTGKSIAYVILMFSIIGIVAALIAIIKIRKKTKVE